ncbi:MAG: TIGR03621 family F420-dependent LLM class oxidoreductase [Acidimicrobiales bacterium]
MVRFGVSSWLSDSGRQWRDAARRYEQLGYDTVWVADHVGMLDPFTALVAAGSATERIKLGTYVLNVEFWNPLLLARTAATADLMTDGRLVLGLGAGHAQVEFEQAGLPYPPAGQRVDRLAATVPAVRRLMAGETVDEPALRLQAAATGLEPVRPPILVGGNGDRVLTLAATAADVAGVVGFTAGTGRVHSNLSHWSWEGLAERLAFVRAAATGQPPEVDLLVQRVVITDDPAGALADFMDAGMTEEQIDSPFLLVGSEQGVLEHLARLDEMGIDGVTVFARDGNADALAPLLTRLR